MTIRSIPGAALGGRPVSHAANGFIFTRTSLPAGLRLPRHAHQHATLNIVLGGEYAEATSGSSKCYGPMTVISKPPGAEHANSLGKEGARCLVLDLTPARLALIREDARVFEEVRIAPAGAIADLVLRAIGELDAFDPYSPLMLEGLALEIIALVGRGPSPPPKQVSARWLGQVRGLLHSAVDLGATLPTLATLGRAVDRHPVYVARAFRKQFGCPIGEYLRRLRIESARHELARGTPIAKVAARAGFADQSHFSKVFYRHVGVTPGEFRRRVAN